jgi:hypothetical protein
MKLLNKLFQLGVTEGLTFRCERDDGVGMVLVPNPTPNRVNPQAVTMPSHRPVNPRADGRWTAKPLHMVR